MGRSASGKEGNSIVELNRLVTEGRLQESLEIDQVSTLEMVRIINEQDKQVALAVEKELPNIVARRRPHRRAAAGGGRLFYVGAGTSGRLGILDASEIPPTYGAPPDLVQGVIAGGLEGGVPDRGRAPRIPGSRAPPTSPRGCAPATSWWASPPAAGPRTRWRRWRRPAAWGARPWP